MSSINEHIKVIHDKIQRLVKRNAQLQTENAKLAAELGGLRKKEQEYTTVIENISQKVNILQAARGSMSEPEKKEFEKRINLYIKEIEKCIGMLSE